MLRTTYFKALGLTIALVAMWAGTAWAQDTALPQDTTTAPAEATTPAATAAAPAAAAPSETAPATTPATGTAPAGPEAAGDLPRMWSDFIHYIRLGRADAALGFGKGILQSHPNPREVYRLSQDTRDLLATLARGRNLPGMAETVDAIRELIEAGYRQESRDAQQIAAAIDMLTGAPRQYQGGLERLKASGEYAVPQLIQRYGDPKATATLRDRINTVLPAIGKDAARPLCEALDSSDPVVREAICQALGRIGYAHAAPYLRRVLANARETEAVKAAARAALVAVAGQQALERPVANLFQELAEAYYNNNESLRPPQELSTANVWYWQEGVGLSLKEVPSAIFMDVYAMRESRQALVADPAFYPAVSLWLAADLRKESHLPVGEKDPTRAANQPSATFYAQAAGARFIQDVLARALKDHDAAVAQGAIDALRLTVGTENMTKPVEGGANPLVEALSFPGRQVRFSAAEAMAMAMPTERFNGDQLVVNVLIEALRQTGQATALIVDPNAETRNKAKELLRGAGYTVLDADTVPAALSAARQSSGVNLAIMSADVQAPGLEEAVRTVRADSLLAAVPLIIVAEPARTRLATELARGDNMVSVVEPTAVTAESLPALLKTAVAASAGAMTQEQADAWALKAAGIIEQLAVHRTTVFSLSLSEPALVEGLRDRRDAQKIACAEALAALRSGTAQQALADAAGSADAPQAVRVRFYLAAARSVRLIGNQLNEAQAKAVIEMVKSDAAQELRQAASALLGAMSLPSEVIESLITDTNERG